MSNGNPNNPNPNMTTSNLGLLAALGGLGGLFTQNPRQPSVEEIEDTRKWGTNLRDRPLPDKPSHWLQIVGAILGGLGGQYTLNRAYNMRAGANQPNPNLVNTNTPPPNTNNLTPPGNRIPGLVDGRFPLTFNLNNRRPPYTNNNDDLPFTP